jgi:endonuclease III
MATTRRAKASDKQGVSKKLAAVLKKRYPGSGPKSDRSVLMTIIYATCLENASFEQADRAYHRLETEFHDLNEVRVSSIVELEDVFRDVDHRELRALRLRNTLQYVFEKHFAFDFEILRRKTLDLAGKQLARIKSLSPFIRDYTLQATLGSHLLPIDESMCRAGIWLGLIEPGSTPEQAAESLKPAVRKADAPQFCYLLRSLATDPQFRSLFDEFNPNPDDDDLDVDLATAVARLNALIEHGPPKTKSKREPAKKSAAKVDPSTNGGSASTRRKAASGSRKKASDKSAAKSGAAKKSTSAKKSSSSTKTGKKTGKKTKTPAARSGS